MDDPNLLPDLDLADLAPGDLVRLPSTPRRGGYTGTVVKVNRVIVRFTNQYQAWDGPQTQIHNIRINEFGWDHHWPIMVARDGVTYRLTRTRTSQQVEGD